MLDVDRSVAACGRSDQEVGLSDPTTDGVGGETAVQDQRHGTRHGVDGGHLHLGGALAANDDGPGMPLQEFVDDVDLELTAPFESPFEHVGGRKRFTGGKGVVLGTDRAPLRHVAALQRHRRDIVSRGHGWTLGPIPDTILSTHTEVRPDGPSRKE